MKHSWKTNIIQYDIIRGDNGLQETVTQNDES